MIFSLFFSVGVILSCQSIGMEIPVLCTHCIVVYMSHVFEAFLVYRSTDFIVTMPWFTVYLIYLKLFSWVPFTWLYNIYFIMYNIWNIDLHTFKTCKSWWLCSTVLGRFVNYFSESVFYWLQSFQSLFCRGPSVGAFSLCFFFFFLFFPLEWSREQLANFLEVLHVFVVGVSAVVYESLRDKREESYMSNLFVIL